MKNTIAPSARQAARNVLPVTAVLRITVKDDNPSPVRALTLPRSAGLAFAIAIRNLGWAFFIALVIVSPEAVWGQDAKAPAKLTLVRAVMCETIQEYAPANPAVVFSIKLGRVSCFTEFDPVPEKTYIHHKWYQNDSLITEKRLTINPPRWSSFTSVQLRDADKGPWRVEITDENDTLMRTLRFSITD